MKRFAAITLLCLLFSSAFVAGKGVQTTPEYPDSLRSLYLYTEGIKETQIGGDTLKAGKLFSEAIRHDPAFAPAYYELASNVMSHDVPQAISLAQKAYQLDSTNKWYLQLYGQMLLVGQQYDDARLVFRRLLRLDPQNPDNYRILAALYEMAEQPDSAILELNSAELRFGKIPLLNAMKRRLQIQTRQFDEAITEAKALAEAVPYEAQNHVILAELYGITGKDSLARSEYAQAMKIDSTDVTTLMSQADYYNDKQDFWSLLSLTKRIFASDALTAESKVKRFGQFTADIRFYKEYYAQLDELASTLISKYPNNKQVVDLYAKHLIASGEIDQALCFYKQHLLDTPPEKDYFLSVIEIEGYKQRPDSLEKYISQALVHFSNDPTFHIARGHAQSYAKQLDAAIGTYKDALKYVTTDTLRGVVWGYIGDVWQQKGLGREKERKRAMKECYKSYDKSLFYYKDNALVLNNYAYFLSEEGHNLERALEMSSRVVALTDNNPTYLDTYAWVLFKLGRTAEAKKIMQQAIALDRQNSPELQLHYGDILAALGEKFMAEMYWRKALENGYDADKINQRIENLKSK